MINLNALDLVTKQFRAQPIIAPESLDIVGIELLNRMRLDFNDIEAMLAVDIRSMESAALLAHLYNYQWRIHFNVEVSSLLDARWQNAMAGVMCPSVVVEIVERHDLLISDEVFHKVQSVANLVRNYGGKIALDDVTCTTLELKIIELMKPEIVKLEGVEHIDQVRKITGANLLIERIENSLQAGHALLLGADELQGYWCDVLVADCLPSAFTPPGVAALGRVLARHDAT